MASPIKIVGKIGSMALIRQEDRDIDYNIFSRLGKELVPGMVWVSSGATEIGRLDYINRHGKELVGDSDLVKADYAAQGQSILMENYRKFVNPNYSIRQLLVEHTHFNDADKVEHIKKILTRCPDQNAIPIINYNDPVSYYENRRRELSMLESNGTKLVECVDNDETASVICDLIQAETLVILTNVDGIYRDASDPSTLVEEIVAKDSQQLQQRVKELQQACIGASRQGANGAFAKLEYVMSPAMHGTRVLIGHARHKLSDIIAGNVKCTRIEIE